MQTISAAKPMNRVSNGDWPPIDGSTTSAEARPICILAMAPAMAAALIVCMAAGVHHLWIASIAQSYTLFPVGGLPPAQDFAMLAVRVLGQATALGVSLAAPFLIYGAIFNLGLGLAARVAPAIQVFFITQPLNLVLGVALLAMVLGTMLTGFAAAMTAFMQNGWSF